MFGLEVIQVSASPDSDTIYAQCMLMDKVDGINQFGISFSVNVPKNEANTIPDYEVAAKDMALDIIKRICADVLVID